MTSKNKVAELFSIRTNLLLLPKNSIPFYFMIRNPKNKCVVHNFIGCVSIVASRDSRVGSSAGSSLSSRLRDSALSHKLGVVLHVLEAARIHHTHLSN